MPKTGAHLKVRPFGSNVLGVRLEGDRRQPEPAEFRVSFQGGDISVVRCTDGSYWAHVSVDHEQAGWFDSGSMKAARLTDARLDIVGKHAAETNPGDFLNDGLYHLAVRIAIKEPK